MFHGIVVIPAQSGLLKQSIARVSTVRQDIADIAHGDLLLVSLGVCTELGIPLPLGGIELLLTEGILNGVPGLLISELRIKLILTLLAVKRILSALPCLLGGILLGLEFPGKRILAALVSLLRFPLAGTESTVQGILTGLILLLCDPLGSVVCLLCFPLAGVEGTIQCVFSALIFLAPDPFRGLESTIQSILLGSEGLTFIELPLPFGKLPLPALVLLLLLFQGGQATLIIGNLRGSDIILCLHLLVLKVCESGIVVGASLHPSAQCLSVSLCNRLVIGFI